MPTTCSFLKQKDLVALGSLLATLSFASASAASQTPALDEVLVTAQRYSQDIQDVPLNVTRISGVEIERAGIFDIGDLTTRVPGFAANTGGLPSLYLRGIGSNDLGAGGDPSVGSYQDGIYLGRSAGQIFELLDVERVEVLHGPQGVLFGRNSAGGAINIITRKPQREWGANLSAEYGSYNQQRVTATMNAPLADPWFLRVAGSNLRRDGFIHNDYDDSAVLNADQRALRSTLLYAPASRWQLQLQLSTERKDSDGASGRSINPSYLPGDPYDNYFSDLEQSYEKREILFGNVHVEYRAEQWRLESISGYRTLRFDDLVDATGTGLRSVRLYAGTDEENRQFSQDLLWHGSNDFARVTLGASYYRQRSDQRSQLLSTSETVNFAASQLYGVLVEILPPGLAHNENSHNGGTFTAWSGFADTALTLSSQWELVAGLRYSYDDKRHFVDGGGSNNTLALIFPDTPRTHSQAHWSDWTPRAGINLHIHPRALLYVNYSEGYKSGGFNAFVPAAKFGPEHVKQFELGAKWSGWQQRLRINTAVFDYRYRDLQVSVLENSQPVIRNAAQARGRGVDIDIAVQPVARWQFGFVASWLDAEFTEFEIEQGNVAKNYSGNALTYSPDKQLSAYIDNETMIGAQWKLQSRLHYSFSGQQYFDVSNRSDLTENAINQFDLRIGFGPRDERWLISAFGNNLSDSEYVVMKGGIGRDSLNAPTARRGLPRTLGMRGEIRW